MKFICDKQSILEAINVVQKAVSTKSTLPVLEGILVNAQNDSVTLTGNDLEISIEYTFPAQIINGGNIVLNSKIFGDIVRKLPDAPIHIETTEKNITNISCADVNFDILGLAASEFPKVPKIDRDFYIEIKDSVLKSMIRQTIYAVAVTDTKPILTGSLFEINDSVLTVVSVDGYRIAQRNEPIKQTAKNIKVVIPGKTLGELLKIIKEEDKDIKIYISDKHVLFESEEFIVTSRLIEGEYFNYAGAIPNDYKLKVIANVGAFVDSIERAALIIANNATKSPLKIRLSDDKATLTCSSQIGTVSDVVQVKAEGGEIEIGFNYKYLLDAFRACDCEEVSMEFNSALSPCVIRPLEGNKFMYMVLPVRLPA